MTPTTYGFNKSDAKGVLDNYRISTSSTKTRSNIRQQSDPVLWVKLTEEISGSDGKKWTGSVQDFDGETHTDRSAEPLFTEDFPLTIVGGGTASADTIVRAEVGGSLLGRAVWVAVVSSGGGGNVVAPGPQIKMVKNITPIYNDRLEGDFEIEGATDMGTFDSEEELLAEDPNPLSGSYARVLLLDPKSRKEPPEKKLFYFVASKGDGEWVNTWTKDKRSAGIEGTWSAAISDEMTARGSVLVGQYLLVIKGRFIWNAHMSFPIVRG